MGILELFRKKVFPALAGALWVCFLFLDLTGLCDSRWVKFASICLCCLTALLGAKTTDGRLVAVAMCFTVAADWFLLVLDKHYTLGIGLFLIVQGIYAYRLYILRERKICKWGVILRLIALMGALLLLPLAYLLLFYCAHTFLHAPPETVFHLPAFAGFFASLALPLLSPPLFYFSNLSINTLEAFALKKRTFAFGLLLFVCCDLCVGAYNLDLLPAFTFPGMWLFYLPSQVLIVLSQETGDTHEKVL